MSAVRDRIAAERRRQRGKLARASLLAALVGASSVLLLGLSGWFITAAAYAGIAEIAAAQSFNYMLPSAAIRLLAIVRTGARYGERLASHDAAFAALARLRPALFQAVARGPAARALSLSTGEASARMVQDIDAIEADFVRLSAPWGLAAAAVSGGLLLLVGGWRPAAASGLCLLLLLGIGRWLAARLRAPGAEALRAAGRLKEDIALLTEAAPELRCYNLDDWARTRIAEGGEELGAACCAAARAEAWFELLSAAAIGAAAVLALFFAAPAGAAVAALCALAAAMMIDGAAPLLRALAQQGRRDEAEARLDMLLADEGRAADEGAETEPLRFIAIGPATVGRGERLAIVGPSGAGKSTIVETLLGLRRAPVPGLTAEGVEVTALPATRLRRSFAWAPQDASLLSGTVRDNLRLAAPGADDGALWAALHDAALDDRIRAMPDELDCWIGENGESLSGGERRRLAVARALLSDAPWLLLDEPAEGLDADSEAMLAARIDARLNETGQGLLIVSHRPAMLALCSREVSVPLNVTGARPAAIAA